MGRKLGFPTVNLNAGSFGSHYKTGVYACQVKVGSKGYKGALHFGPKKGVKKEVLEIHLLNFRQNVYGKWVIFRVTQSIRPLKSFQDWEELKQQIEKDVQIIQSLPE